MSPVEQETGLPAGAAPTTESQSVVSEEAQSILPEIDRGTSVDLSESAKAVSRSLMETHTQYRVAIAQISTNPGAILANTDKIISYLNEARSKGAQLVVFPELAVTGYCSMDLFWDKDYLAANLAAINKIREATAGMTVVVGFVDVDPNGTRSGGRPKIYNSAAIIHDGKVVGVQDKTLLPNYDIFYEERYFSPPRPSKVFQVGPIRLGTEICEDLWTAGYNQDPTRRLVDAGAELVVNLSASPFNIGKVPVRHSLLAGTARDHGVPMVYANLVGAFDGFEGEVVFDGRSMVVNQAGRLTSMGQGFKEQLIISDVFAKQEMELPPVEELEELHDALVLGIKDYFRRVGSIDKANFKHAYIGLSGGIDSAVVAALAVEALGADKVIGVTLPSRYNSSETKDDARRLAENLGIRFKSMSIEKQVEACLATFAEHDDLMAAPEGVSNENVQARLRMLDLMFCANRTNGVVLNTGNKTELALDNCTIYGDMVGGFSVLGDVDKDRVFALARYINQRAHKEVIPISTIEREPSAELKPGQVDADVMGARPERIAPLVRAIIEEKLAISEALERFGEEYGEALIRRTYQRLDRSEWKRRQAAPGIRVTSHAFGVGRLMPISHGFHNSNR
jgi:NAD+ synthase (glutamine-hydrolysing)